MRGKLIALVVGLVIVAPAAQARPRHGVRESAALISRSVAFTVTNTNRSMVPCSSDGNSYTVVGSMVLPAGTTPHGVTLYLHGSGNGKEWHFTRLPGHDHITEMARLRHASVFIDQLGYGASDIPDGNEICVGSLADMAAQVAGELRSGEYTVDLDRAPRFSRVALAGHSAGGAFAELAGYSFPTAFDALVLVGWVSTVTPQASEQGRKAQGAAGPGAYRGIVVSCATPGPKRPGSASGYATIFNRDEIAALFVDGDQELIDSFTEGYEPDACGAARSISTEIITAQAGVPTIAIPTLVVLGEHDISGAAGGEAERARLVSSPDAGLYIVPGSGHMMMLERNAGSFRATLSDWLSRRGF
jgi:pimeloyl-ACP methyl ester carboxylesterase